MTETYLDAENPTPDEAFEGLMRAFNKYTDSLSNFESSVMKHNIVTTKKTLKGMHSLAKLLK